MATYLELTGIARSNALLERMAAAVAIQAEAVRVEPPATPNHDNRLLWSKQTFENPAAMAVRMIWAVLAQNATAPESAILNATDVQLLAAVAAAVDVFATGE